jgi:hypothetical protein
MWFSLWILKVLEMRSAFTGHSDGTINLLSDPNFFTDRMFIVRA